MDLTGRLRHINSATKYPSIPSYHRVNPADGVLDDEHIPLTGTFDVTEKIDGTNARIIVMPDGDWIVGSREELLCAKHDRIPNPSLGIVAALRDHAGRIAARVHLAPTVYYGEVYGGGIGPSWRHYAKAKSAVAFRLFDMAVLDDLYEMFDWPVDKVAAWRDHGGQPFASVHTMRQAADIHGLPTVPRVASVDDTDIPDCVEETRAWMNRLIGRTNAAIDTPAGAAEGLVLRDRDRKTVVKLRFDDYDRTLRKRGKR